VFALFPVSPADVDFWINGGWDQPNCGITVNLLFFLQMSNIDDLNGKDYIQGSLTLLKLGYSKEFYITINCRPTTNACYRAFVGI
jgi:hypothetical protein